MTQRNIILILLIFTASYCQGQPTSFTDSTLGFQKAYMANHEVVLNDDKKFLQFFPPDSTMRVWATFTPAKNAKWFSMKTSGTTSQVYRKYGLLTFKIHDTLLRLNVYQSQSLMTSKDYSDYLFVPFTDNTSGNESYGGGRYLDYKMQEIHGNKLLIDFNKAYNPYCAYTTGYNCPIPPAENDLKVAITAGEKVYLKKH
jgi:uncharacterized protein (DUF1684 family)